MPNMRGPNTFMGYKQPKATGHSKAEQYVLRHVYGKCRSRNPGENPMHKAMCARIAWSAAKRARGY
jgi:hypothetical protein